jgi:hypothetical protein
MGRLFGTAAIAAGFASGFTGAPAGADGSPGLAAAPGAQPSVVAGCPVTEAITNAYPISP